MKKLLFTMSVVLFLIVNLTGCTFKAEYKFVHPEDQIEKIESVEVSHNKKNSYEYDFVVKKELSEEERKNFIEDMKNIDYFHKTTNPGYIYDGTKAFRISYFNGDYEIISRSVQSTYIEGKYKDTGFNYFDDDQFDELLNKYSN